MSEKSFMQSEQNLKMVIHTQKNPYRTNILKPQLPNI